MKYITIAITILFMLIPSSLALAQDTTPPSVEDAKEQADQLAQDAANAKTQADAAQAEANRARQSASVAQASADRARAEAIRLESEAATKSANEATAQALAAMQVATLADRKAVLARASADALHERALITDAIIKQQRGELTEASASLEKANRQIAGTLDQLDAVRRDLAVSNARVEILLKAAIGLFALLVLGTIAVMVILRRQSQLIAKTIATAAESIAYPPASPASSVVVDAQTSASDRLRVRHIDHVRGDLLDNLGALFND
jgi:hypothetical protein